MTDAAGPPGGRHFRRRRRRLPLWAAVIAAVAVVTGGAAVAALQLTAGRRPAVSAPAATTTTTTSAPSPPAPATGSGPDGVTSRAVAAENAKPGTAAWRITAEPPTGFIAGFADTTYAAAGQTVGVYVSTSAPTFVLHAYRMGWYGGLGGREVWRSSPVVGVHQPACPLDHRTNMVSCDDWSESLVMPVTAAFVPGDYLLELVGSGGEESYILLTVWDPHSTAAYLVMSRSLTEEGWNTYGGYSYYQGSGPCILGQVSSYPQCNRARVVSFDRPDGTNHGASDFLSNEFPMVQLLEREGLDVSYVTDITVTEHPDVLLAHRVLLSLGHDETWTYRERQAAAAAYAHGVNFFFGAAAVLRHSRLEPSPLGPDRQEVDYRDSNEDPLYRTGGDPLEVTGNTWMSPPANWSEIPFVGEEYSGYLSGVDTVPLVVSDAASWVFQGTGLRDGSQVPGVVGSDFDHLDPAGGSPADIDVLGHSPVPLTEAFTTQGKWDGRTWSDMTYYSDPKSGAGVLDAGTVNWIYALASCPPARAGCGAATVAAITNNILKVFGAGPAGATHPSTPNWKTITPYGS